MTPVRTRIDKRQALLDAAFAVFARQGYALSCVQEIADEAGVAKPTVYSYFTDKAGLFHAAVRAVAHSALQERLAALEPLTDPGPDLGATLEHVGYALLRLHSDERSWALRRLLFAELTRLPGLHDVLRESGPQRLHHALAGALARLMVAGRLRNTEPERAAEQFVALVTWPAEARSAMGTCRIDDGEARAIARAAAGTFLHAMTE